MPPHATTDLGYIPPDGGWGWVVVCGAFVSIGFSYSLPRSITVFFKEIQTVFDTSFSEIAWISSIMLAFMYGGGLISSTLVNRYGSRPVVITGGLLCGIGMISASFCTNIVQLYICIGVFAGLGLSFNLQPSLIIIGKYFFNRRPMAIGLSMAGSPVLLCTFALFNQFLFDLFGWRGSFLILGGILLNCCVAGALFRPIQPVIDSSKKKISKYIQEEAQEVSKKFDCLQATSLMTANENEKKENCCDKLNKYLDFSLLKHRGFLIYLVGNVILFFGFFVPIVFLIPYGKHLGFDEYSSAFLLSALAIADMIARPTTGLIANIKWMRPRVQYFLSFSIIFNGFCHLMCPFALSYIGVVIYSTVFGLAFGMVCALLFEALMDIVGAQRFGSAVGIVTLSECFPLLFGPPVGGIIVDTFSDYKYMFYKCGAVMLTAGIFLFIMNYYSYRMIEKEAGQQQKEAARKETKGLMATDDGYGLGRSGSGSIQSTKIQLESLARVSP
uniref:Monocarboxylate transporter 2-like n=1 Tax=Geotrypetes seraphini TaxID=260995 RepID=A0A6P8Q6D4_GEOSA|nr:monocarboxylate transporter 2-like [Geotrypetes seraphini]XP_033782621.1 monocarboxylate transporter 2-like [Geotrypetes seraphini]